MIDGLESALAALAAAPSHRSLGGIEAQVDARRREVMVASSSAATYKATIRGNPTKPG
jgi:hypothetical protein